MKKRIIFIVLGAVAVAILLALLWMWFFGGGSSPGKVGEFGAGTDTTRGASDPGGDTNIPGSVGEGTGTGTTAGQGLPQGGTRFTPLSSTSNFGLGSTGVQVASLQNFLIDRGLLTLPSVPLGTFNVATQQALVRYQTSAGLTPTGAVDPATATAINASYAAASGGGAATGNSSAIIFPTFSIGSTGTQVSALQNFLIDRGFLTLPAGISVGSFGALTEQAVMRYQTSIGLDPNGIVGTTTAAAINATLAATTGTTGNAGTTGSTGTVGTTDITGGGEYTPGSIVLDPGPLTGSTDTGLSFSSGALSVPGAAWLGTNATLSTFVPSGINDLNQGSIGGQVSLFGTPPAPNTANNSLNAGLFAAAGVAGALSCTPGLLGSILGFAGNAGIIGSAGNAAIAVPVNDLGTQGTLNAQFSVSNALASNNAYVNNFLDCLTRVWAKVILQQITTSVVNWINSGFNGQPSFVQNFNQFFNRVADQAAGEFIRGSALSFLCSPFQAQIRLAIAKSYAQRNNAASCTFTSIVGNLTQFTSGNFSAGGWKGLISLNTMPTNNPYGAFMYGQIGLAGAQATAVGNKRIDLVSGRGFLSFEKEENCRVVNGARVCDKKIATPGSVIAESLNATNKSSLDSLNLAKHFDEIISALITQLMTKMLQGGLSGLSGTNNNYASNFLTPDQQAAQTQGQALLQNLQNVVQVAQQYGSAKQGSARDIQTLQQQYLSLQNCWEIASSSPTLTAAQQLQAAQNGGAAGEAIVGLETEIMIINADITRANAAIALLQELQTRTLRVNSTADVAAVGRSVTDAQNAGLLILPADLTQAQQDRAALQTHLGAATTQIQTGLQQCYAFGQ